MTGSKYDNMAATQKDPEIIPGTPAVAEKDTEKTAVVDDNISEFCTVDPETGEPREMTLEEKERLFLDAVQSYFHEGATMSDSEFDALKEELTWQGSEVTSLSRDEIRFLDAARAYERGETGFMSDEDYDALKVRLQQAGSIVSIQRGPRCSVRDKIVFSDVIPDKKRTLALYIPASLLVSLGWLSAAFEFTPLHTVDPVLSLIIGSPIIYLFGRVLTGLIVPDPVIVVGDCPHCGRRTRVFFGNVLNVDGFAETAEIKCEKCKSELRVERDTNRMILVKEGNIPAAALA